LIRGVKSAAMDKTSLRDLKLTADDASSVAERGVSISG
jgi:hypothetical protein